MHFGITMIPADFAVSPVRLGVLVEEFGFESVWIGEHSHIPVGRTSAYPSGGELPDEFLHFHDTMISLAAMEGDSLDWPAHTARMASATSSIGISFSRYPEAPALMAS